MLQQDTPEEFVFATGECHSVREFVEATFRHLGLDWREFVVEDAALLRPAEVAHLVGDASKARQELGWSPVTSFSDLIKQMVEADLRIVRSELAVEAATK